MQRLRADLSLLLVALIWGSAFAVQRVAADHFDAFTFNGLRFLLGGLILAPVAAARLTRQAVPATTSSHRQLLFVGLGGLLLFGAGGLQQLGLELTTAGNAGFITTLYVVFIPLILRIFWRARIRWISWAGAGMAVAGSLLLSTGGRLRLSAGDAYELGGAVLWALHVILVSRAVRHMPVVRFSSGQYLVAGVLNLLVSRTLIQPQIDLPGGWWTIVYIGVLSTAVGYTLQVYGQKYAPPHDAAILLSMEAVFAALTGYIFLNEVLLPVQVLGCGLILGAILLVQLNTWRGADDRIRESPADHPL